MAEPAIYMHISYNTACSRYFEVSSATGENVMKMYDTLLAKIVNRR